MACTLLHIGAYSITAIKYISIMVPVASHKKQIVSEMQSRNGTRLEQGCWLFPQEVFQVNVIAMQHRLVF